MGAMVDSLAPEEASLMQDFRGLLHLALFWKATSSTPELGTSHQCHLHCCFQELYEEGQALERQQLCKVVFEPN